MASKQTNPIGAGTQNITANVPEEIAKEIDAEAVRRGVSRSFLLRQFINDGLKSRGIDPVPLWGAVAKAREETRIERLIGRQEPPSQASGIAAPPAGRGASQTPNVVTSETLPNVEPDARDRVRDGALRAKRIARGKKS